MGIMSKCVFIGLSTYFTCTQHSAVCQQPKQNQNSLESNQRNNIMPNLPAAGKNPIELNKTCYLINYRYLTQIECAPVIRNNGTIKKIFYIHPVVQLARQNNYR